MKFADKERMRKFLDISYTIELVSSTYSKNSDAEKEKMAKQLEDEIFGIIADDEKMYEMQNYAGMNLGMLACKYNLKNLAKKAIQYPTTFTQKDKEGRNFADYFAKYTNWKNDELLNGEVEEKGTSSLIDDLHKEMLGF